MIKQTLKKGFTLVELLVVIAIIAILAATLLPVVSSAITEAKMASMRDQGVGLYKAIFASETSSVFDDVEAFPSSGNASNTTSTIYFTNLIKDKILDSDFSIFAGPGQRKAKTTDDTEFEAKNCGWSVVLDTADSSSMVPLFYSRNLILAGDTLPPAANDTDLSADGVLGEDPSVEGKLKFNKIGAIVINKIGAGNILKAKDLSSSRNFNPTEEENDVLTPE